MAWLSHALSQLGYRIVACSYHLLNLLMDTGIFKIMLKNISFKSWVSTLRNVDSLSQSFVVYWVPSSPLGDWLCTVAYLRLWRVKIKVIVYFSLLCSWIQHTAYTLQHTMRSSSSLESFDDTDGDGWCSWFSLAGTEARAFDKALPTHLQCLGWCHFQTCVAKFPASPTICLPLRVT